MFTYSTSTYSHFIKNRFPQREIDSLVTFQKPFLERVKRVDDLYGDTTYLPIEMDHPQGLGSLITQLPSTARSYVTGTRGKRWGLTRAKGYAMVLVDGETMMAAASNEGAWFRTREREVKNMLEQLGQQLEMFCFRDGSGSIGKVTTDPGTGTTFTLASIPDALNFHEGMWVQFYADSSGIPSTSARSGGPYQVTGVAYDTGIITVSAAIDADVLSSGSTDHVVRFTNADYIASTPAGLRGLAAWIPSSAPTDTLFGVARTGLGPKVSGFRQSWLGSIEETAKTLDAVVRRHNQMPKTLWLSYANFNRLEIELGARGMRVEDGSEGKFGRAKLMMATPGGGVEVVAAPYCPDDVGYLLDMATWELHHRGGLPHIIEDDGNVALRIQSFADGATAAIADGIEVRFRWFAQLACTNPLANGRIAIS